MRQSSRYYRDLVDSMIPLVAKNADLVRLFPLEYDGFFGDIALRYNCERQCSIIGFELAIVGSIWCSEVSRVT